MTLSCLRVALLCCRRMGREDRQSNLKDKHLIFWSPALRRAPIKLPSVPESHSDELRLLFWATDWPSFTASSSWPARLGLPFCWLRALLCELVRVVSLACSGAEVFPVVGQKYFQLGPTEMTSDNNWQGRAAGCTLAAPLPSGAYK